MAQQPTGIYEFAGFQLHASKRRLSKNGEALQLAAKAIDVLLVLVENRGRVVEKDELMQKVWADSFVEEANLTVHMSALRKALGENKNAPRCIATISGRGYRFIAEVRELDQATDDSRIAENRSLQEPPANEDLTAGETDAAAPAVSEQAVVLAVEKRPELIVEEHTLSRVTLEDRQPMGSARSMLPRVVARHRLMWAILLTAIAAGATFVIYRFVSQSSASPAPIKSIAVLPFKPINAAAGNEILELGMAETLITKFSSTGRIIVRPISAIRKYTNAEQDPLAVGKELGVDAVLEGNLQRLGDRLRITVRLMSVKDGLSLWAEKYDQSYRDIFEVQDKVSEQVTQALALTLSGEEQRQLSKHPTNNPDAYQAYLQGRYFWNKRTQEGYRKAIEYYNEALQLDANFALAYSGLADCYLFTAERLPAREAMPKARDAAIKALQLDDSLAEAHTSLAKVQQHFDWDWAAAEQSFKRAIALNPNYSTAHHWYAQYLMDVGRTDEAIREIQQARALEPYSLIINTDVGSIYQDARQYDQAIVVFRKVIEMDANFARAHFELGRALEQKGLYEEAVKEIEKAIELSQPTPRLLASLGYIYAVSGNAAKAQESIEKLRQASRQDYVSPYHFALIAAGLGKTDEALNFLEQAYQERFGLLVYLRIEPRFDNLRSEPRFIELLRRIRLA